MIVDSGTSASWTLATTPWACCTSSATPRASARLTVVARQPRCQALPSPVAYPSSRALARLASMPKSQPGMRLPSAPCAEVLEPAVEPDDRVMWNLTAVRSADGVHGRTRLMRASTSAASSLDAQMTTRPLPPGCRSPAVGEVAPYYPVEVLRSGRCRPGAWGAPGGRTWLRNVPRVDLGSRGPRGGPEHAHVPPQRVVPCVAPWARPERMLGCRGDVRKALASQRRSSPARPATWWP